MICNELYNEQGLGNQLWNYVVTRVIADRNGYEFSILKNERFKGRDFMDIDFGAPLSGGQTSPKGYLFSLPDGIEHYYRERSELLIKKFTDISDDVSRTDPHLLSLPDRTKFEGNCQSTKYLEGYREKILQWTPIKENYAQYTVPSNICVIHLRLGDFKQTKAFLPMQYYRDAMAYVQSINPQVIFQCVTDQKEEAEALLPGITVIGSSLLEANDAYRADHHFGGPIGIDFCLLRSAEYLIIPNSSFSWWAAYLNTNKKLVVAPKYWARFNIADGFWSPSDIITDEFTYLDKEGKTFSAAECWAEKDTFEKEHQDMFHTVPHINDSWKPRPLLIAYLIFIIKKIPTIKQRLFTMLKSA